MATALLCVGCTEDKPREPDPTTKPSPTATVPSMPTMPNQARDVPPEGAAAFVRYYVALFNYGAQTGNTAPMLALSSGCVACSKYAESFETVHARGDHIAAKLWDLRTIDLRMQGDSIDVLTTIQMIEKGKPTKYQVGFVVPVKPPYSVNEIFEQDSR
ncbi:MAG: DUF6318 family protein [Aeromicrobium sp.]